MALLVLRAIFFMVAMGIAVLIFGSEGIRQGPSWVPWAVLLGMAAVPLTVIGIDTSIKRKDLTVITAVYFGMLVGVFLTYVAILALVPIIPSPPRNPIFDWLPLILGMVLCYVCTSLLIQTRNDFRFLIPFGVQIGLYVSPVGFQSSVVPEHWRPLYSLNPVVGIIDGFRWCIIGGESPIYWPGFLVSLVVVAFFLWLGVRTFRRTERGFSDLI